ncbi:SGNH/GDSL hydrolase family protein [Ornithinimicrobium sp. LYQ92]|uniref:SGNH/GDSL hydrolase family protein n=1 Tax=Serinicoccus sp. LYQ92 TaxID=3378798 RepID=UPI0038535DAB
MTDPTWITTPITEGLVRGAAELEQTEHGVLVHRLPAWARQQWVDPQLTMVESQPSGVRIAFRSSATVIEVDVLRSRMRYAGLPPRPDGVLELAVDGQVVDHAVTAGGVETTVDLATGDISRQVGQPSTARFAGLGEAMKDVEVWLPHNESVEVGALRTDAPVEEQGPTVRRVWLHHGSSISHGSNATRPTGIWPVAAARSSDVDLVNLGLGGSALLDPFTARTMRDTAADVISVKIGINLVNADLMRMRGFGPAVHGFLDTVREGHPNSPLLVVSPIYCEIHEYTPGPGAFDPEAAGRGEIRFIATGDPAEGVAGRLTLRTIREALAEIVKQRQAADPHLFYLDGRELYSESDAAEHPLPDALHPDAETHRLIGERFARLAFGAGGSLA